MTAGAVSAAENVSDVQTTVESDTSAVGQDDVAVESSDDDVNSEEVLKSRNVHEFNGTTCSQLQSKINTMSSGDTLVLNNDIVQEGYTSIDLSFGLTILGNGHKIYTGDHGLDLFVVNCDQHNIIFDNITFILFDSDDSVLRSRDHGNAITFSNCNFVGDNFNGHSNIIDIFLTLYYYNNVTINCTVVNCTFSDIPATPIFFSSDCGNLINYIIDNCTFINNDADVIYSSNINSATIVNSKFINNDDKNHNFNVQIKSNYANISNCYFSNCTRPVSIDSSTNYTAYNNVYDIYHFNIVVLDNSSMIAQRGKEKELILEINADEWGHISFPVVYFVLDDNLKIPATPRYFGVYVANYQFNDLGLHHISAYIEGCSNYTVYMGSVNVVDNTFTNLQDLINNATSGSVINLNQDYIYTPGVDEMTSGIVINKTLTINGNGHTIDALSKSRIFNITSDGVVLTNITFTNAYGYVLGNSTCGGAVYCSGNYINITGCDFVNNNVTYNLTGANMGGAIHFENVNHGNIINCNFINNTAAARGAISLTNCSYFTITESNFINNTALTTWNGVIGFSGNNFIFRNCVFENNKAAKGGGVGSFNGDNHIIDNCTFKNNSATDTGCMNWVGVNGVILNSRFIENTADYHGILCARNINGTIYNCSFTKNRDNSYAGALNINADNITVSGCKFNENTAKNGGGAIFIGNFFTKSGFDYPVIIKDSLFAGNGEYEIILDTLANCTFKNNTVAKFIKLTRGNITSKTHITVLNNATLNVKKDESFNLTAVVRDDNNNIIIVDDLKFTVNNVSIDATCYNGVFKANYVFNEYGNYPIGVEYNKNSLVNAVISPALITTKLNLTIDLPLLVNLTVGNAIVNIEVSKNVTGNITITVHGVDYIEPINNGIAKVNLTYITPGTYNACVKYSGDDVYLPTTTNTTIIINKKSTSSGDINITDLGNSTVGSAELIVKVPLDFTGNITVSVNGKNYTSVIYNGTATVDLSSVEAGNHTATITYSGDENNTSVSKDTIIVIDKIPTPASNINITNAVNLTSGNATLIVNVPQDYIGNITVNIAGENYTAPITNGTAKVNLNSVKPGSYNSTVYYSGDKLHSWGKISIIIKIPEPVITLIGNDLNALYSASAVYKVLVLSDAKFIKDAENVVITYNGVKYNVKTLSGYATLPLKTTLKVGSYTITVNYANKVITNKIVIKNIINAKKLKKLKKSKKINKVKVSLAKVNGKYLKGKKLTLKLKGKKVASAKTNKKGVATFKVKKKKLKKFKKGKKVKATVSFGKDVVTKKIKIV